VVSNVNNSFVAGFIAMHRKKPISKLGTHFLIILLFLLLILTPVGADIGPKPPPPPASSGLGGEYPWNSYLKTVDVAITAYDDIAHCNGTFLIANPNPDPEDLQLFFDPGQFPSNAIIRINDSAIGYNLNLTLSKASAKIVTNRV